MYLVWCRSACNKCQFVMAHHYCFKYMWAGVGGSHPYRVAVFRRYWFRKDAMVSVGGVGDWCGFRSACGIKFRMSSEICVSFRCHLRNVWLIFEIGIDGVRRCDEGVFLRSWLIFKFHHTCLYIRHVHTFYNNHCIVFVCIHVISSEGQRASGEDWFRPTESPLYK